MFIVGIIFVIIAILAFIGIWRYENTSREWIDTGWIFLTILCLFMGIAFILGGYIAHADYEELINTPAVIENAKQNIRTPEEKAIVNNMIVEYNNEVAEVHEELLFTTEKNKKEQQIFELQPIALIP